MQAVKSRPSDPCAVVYMNGQTDRERRHQKRNKRARSKKIQGTQSKHFPPDLVHKQPTFNCNKSNKKKNK